MGDNVEIDLYEELDQEFIPHNQEYENADLYDDVLPNSNSTPNNNNSSENNNSSDHHHHRHSEETNGYNPNLSLNHIARRHQLYVGNLSWWTTDQDITDSVVAIGVNDFQEVKFFENRANGQSKGFCVITLGSENSMRIVMENLSKKELNGQNPMVTLPTKQALNQFESQQKTRPTPPTPNPGQKGPMGMGGNSIQNIPPQGMGGGGGHQMMRNGPPNNFRPMGMQNMQQGPPMQGGGPMQQRMQGPPMHQGGPPMNHQQQQGMPPRFQNNWNGPPRPGMNNGMNNRPPGPNGPPLGHRPQMNMPNPGPPRGPRPDWNRPPMHPGNYNNQGPQQNMQVPPHIMQGPPRNMPPQMPVNPHGPPQALHGGPAPHVNPAFFNQQNAMPPQHSGVGPVMGGPHGMPGNIPNIPHFNQQAPGPRNMWPIVNNKPGFEQPTGPLPQISEVEFEEIMGRNRTVSSSAIARAVSDAAAGEYTSAIETLATAISLIKQSKVANDERCKILINSLQDTLHGIETKSYNRRDRSRSRERSHRRQRRERSSSRSYRDRSRDRDREEGRDRPREGNSRSRPRNKSPEPSESVTDNSKRGGFYDERYRSDRDSRGDRDRREDRRH